MNYKIYAAHNLSLSDSQHVGYINLIGQEDNLLIEELIQAINCEGVRDCMFSWEELPKLVDDCGNCALKFDCKFSKVASKKSQAAKWRSEQRFVTPQNVVGNLNAQNRKVKNGHSKSRKSVYRAWSQVGLCLRRMYAE